ncbi:MAG: GNAT family N-acetyltransferase [Deltaproteobacteria bacterium]|nr:GNAT family N-acetyltransferase [Deltaproteobacteria bacterium]
MAVRIRLVAIGPNGIPEERIDLPPLAALIAEETAGLYRGYPKPWVGYLSVEGETVVGSCAFKTPPIDGRVEIAYTTFPGHEGAGYATAMARSLIAIAHHEHVAVIARTTPEANAATAILEKLHFRRARTILDADDGTVWEWDLSPVPEPS